MTEQTIRILGVYKPVIPAHIYREQWPVTASDGQTDAHFEKLVLLEAIVTGIVEEFKMMNLGQTVDVPGFERHFQCAYDEALLSAHGNSVIDRRMKCVGGPGALRFAFYLHFYDPSLRRLVPYRACT